MKTLTELCQEHVRDHGTTAVKEAPDDLKRNSPQAKAQPATSVANDDDADNPALARLQAAMKAMTAEQISALTWTDKIVLAQGRTIEVAKQPESKSGESYSDQCRKHLAEKKGKK